VKVDLKRLGLVNDDAQNRDKWRSLTTGNCLSTVMRVGSYMDCVLVTLNVSSSSNNIT